MFLNALLQNEYDRGDADISVSSLLLPPRIFQLRERHKDEIVVDVIDEIWKILGSVVHLLLEKYAPKNTLTEERLDTMIAGWKVSGKFDLYDGGLDDYKFTSGWSLVFGSRIEEWGWQLNFYKCLAEEHGLEVKSLRNILIIRDWSAHQAKQNKEFPQAQVAIISQPFEYDAWKLMNERVIIHQENSDLKDNDLPVCTPEERWASKDVYAVMKEGRKSALKLFDAEIKAYNYLGMTNKKDKCFVEKREGESKRCENYCEANQFCNFYKEVLCQK